MISKIMRPIVFIGETSTPENSAKMKLEKGVSSLAIEIKDNLKGNFYKNQSYKILFSKLFRK